MRACLSPIFNRLLRPIKNRAATVREWYRLHLIREETAPKRSRLDVDQLFSTGRHRRAPARLFIIPHGTQIRQEESEQISIFLHRNLPGDSPQHFSILQLPPFLLFFAQPSSSVRSTFSFLNSPFSPQACPQVTACQTLSGSYPGHANDAELMGGVSHVG